MMPMTLTLADHDSQATRYGRLATVASAFHVSLGGQADLEASYWYARYAARHAGEVLAELARRERLYAADDRDWAARDAAYCDTFGTDSSQELS